MADQVKVIIEDDQVQVAFEGTAFYWRFAENGTKNQKPSILLVVRLNKIKIRLKNHDTTNIRFMGRMSNLGKQDVYYFEGLDDILIAMMATPDEVSGTNL